MFEQKKALPILALTHLLLPTLVTRSLDTRLPLLFAIGLVIVMVVVNEAARAALKTSQAGASLALGIRGTAVPRADRAGRAHRCCPSRNHDGPTVHATANFAAMAAERGWLARNGVKVRREATNGGIELLRQV